MQAIDSKIESTNIVFLFYRNEKKLNNFPTNQVINPRNVYPNNGAYCAAVFRSL